MVTGLFCGLATLDVVSHVERAPGRDEKVTASWQVLAGGGPATNAAVTFAAWGGEAVLLTEVGEGPAAGVVVADLAECGVQVLDVAPSGARTPTSCVTVERDGSRRVVGLDAGRWKPAMAELLPRATHVVASAAFRWGGTEDDGPEARLRHLLARLTGPEALAAVTAGEGPILWRSRGADGEREGRILPPRVEAVDTLGAGDALHGAYAWALAGGRPDPLEVAARVASRS